MFLKIFCKVARRNKVQDPPPPSSTQHISVHLLVYVDGE